MLGQPTRRRRDRAPFVGKRYFITAKYRAAGAVAVKTPSNSQYQPEPTEIYRTHKKLLHSAKAPHEA